ncbi:MAG: type II toxin-antitoxin system HicB family antitoxin [Methylobacter sp.]|nr:type II toxin-antitoxin system HicB family antitoxin [Methylobacter sp.]MDP2098691.1 type II toxin-antitoxin system HicB family antitoxin [Methylobacter sp.]MDP2427731.1 type II toxin-antitoxin system HicB family antitoxin [Methylobacter sp.]MDP3054923.1 type II toxin-antitoxin system HicB family antitoxin [Methylobacter sp.]MDP3364144.1 type II toxin-antitoxin system HicB family antitoxin [Methylobacter sp.]
MKYLIIIEKGENGYSAYSPDVPGCIAAGDTEEETRTLMKEAIMFHLEGMAEDGEELPKAKTIAEYVEIAA